MQMKGPESSIDVVRTRVCLCACACVCPLVFRITSCSDKLLVGALLMLVSGSLLLCVQMCLLGGRLFERDMFGVTFKCRRIMLMVTLA